MVLHNPQHATRRDIRRYIFIVVNRFQTVFRFNETTLNLWPCRLMTLTDLRIKRILPGIIGSSIIGRSLYAHRPSRAASNREQKRAIAPGGKGLKSIGGGMMIRTICIGFFFLFYIYTFNSHRK